ncbi:hypothetical protein BC937DRAFT_88266 [Endogone sp. FLAS-F59071]|nr:hypothetical protein BC937DRAFT_88266 [Endogone sp. FLAS-F59071]|eukprot:RUS18857.1 hypothetical protein BC937DRAFT_88266 [Endogone sp. FLAS-F59071]
MWTALALALEPQLLLLNPPASLPSPLMATHTLLAARATTPVQNALFPLVSRALLPPLSHEIWKPRTTYFRYKQNY